MSELRVVSKFREIGNNGDTNHVAHAGPWGSSFSVIYFELELDWLSLDVN